MKETDLDITISGLSSTLLLTDNEAFEEEAEKKALELTTSNIEYLVSRLHNPPIVDSRIDEERLRLGQWQAVCQYSIFELIYHSNIERLELLKRYAYGKYDWTQATALEFICRMYVNGRVSYDIISEIDKNLESMEYETHLYLAQGLLGRANKDKRFLNIINQITSTNFKNAIREVSGKN
jgi:hypothetical protein